MVPPRFVDRDDEHDLLESRFENDNAELVVVYGRRRLGKSALVREAVHGCQDATYWQATERTPDVQRANFVDIANETFPLFTRGRHTA
nr:ATP-binding protein [Natrinema caseinilyticum]